MSSAVTKSWCPGVGVSMRWLFCSSAIAYPQSASGICWFAAGAIGCPSTTRLLSPVTPVSPDALAVPALACVSPVTPSAVISPWKTERLVTWLRRSGARLCAGRGADTRRDGGRGDDRAVRRAGERAVEGDRVVRRGQHTRGTSRLAGDDDPHRPRPRSGTGGAVGGALGGAEDENGQGEQAEDELRSPHPATHYARFLLTPLPRNPNVGFKDV